MPATEQSVDAREAEFAWFFDRATRELKTAVGFVSIYAAVLDAQLAADPALSPLRPVVRDVRAQADLVAALVDRALAEGRPR
jgi:hypothetical protein